MRPPVSAVWAVRAVRSPTDGLTDGLAAGRIDGTAQGAGTRLDSEMAGHTQQPSGRRNPGPAPSPSPGPGPGPGASEPVTLKKEIGLVSACTIIIGEPGPWWVGAPGGRLEARGRLEQGAPSPGAPAGLPRWDRRSEDDQGTCSVAAHTATAGLLVPTSPAPRIFVREGGAGSIRHSNPNPHPAFTTLRGFGKAFAPRFLSYRGEEIMVLPEVQEPCKCGGWAG